MATSGSSNFNQTRNEIVSAALRKCGVLAEGQTATAQMIADGSEDLNRLMKAWQAEGIHIWTYLELVLLLNKTSQFYNLGATGDHCVVKDNLVTTSLAADAALGAGSVTLASVTGVATTYNIGILMDDGNIHWTTVNGAPAGVVVTLTAVTTAAATSGNTVYVYQTKANRPLRIHHARAQLTSTSELEMRPIGRDDYFRLTNKSATGVPVQYHYEPKLENGRLYIWTLPSSLAYKINLTAIRAIEDFDAAGNTGDMPQEYQTAIVWNLAAEIAPEYGVDDSTFMRIQAKAESWYNFISGLDASDVSTIFIPDFT